MHLSSEKKEKLGLDYMSNADSTPTLPIASASTTAHTARNYNNSVGYVS